MIRACYLIRLKIFCMKLARLHALEWRKFTQSTAFLLTKQICCFLVGKLPNTTTFFVRSIHVFVFVQNWPVSCLAFFNKKKSVLASHCEHRTKQRENITSLFHCRPRPGLTKALATVRPPPRPGTTSIGDGAPAITMTTRTAGAVLSLSASGCKAWKDPKATAITRALKTSRQWKGQRSKGQGRVTRDQRYRAEQKKMSLIDFYTDRTLGLLTCFWVFHKLNQSLDLVEDSVSIASLKKNLKIGNMLFP